MGFRTLSNGIKMPTEGFELTNEEMQQIASLDMGYAGTAVKHFGPDFVRMCNGRKFTTDEGGSLCLS